MWEVNSLQMAQKNLFEASMPPLPCQSLGLESLPRLGSRHCTAELSIRSAAKLLVGNSRNAFSIGWKLIQSGILAIDCEDDRKAIDAFSKVVAVSD